MVKSSGSPPKILYFRKEKKGEEKKKNCLKSSGHSMDERGGETPSLPGVP